MDMDTSHMESGKPHSEKVFNVNKSILDIFNDLGDREDTKRNGACIALVQHCVQSTGEELDASSSVDIIYSLKRLIRGLGSTRQLIQKGYFTALVSLFDAVPSISYEKFFEIVEKELGTCKNASKGEEGEATMGQVLAYGAAVRGGLFERSSFEQQQQILAALVSCGKKRSYLPFASSSFIHDLIQKSEKSMLAGVILPILKEEFCKPWEDQTFDSLLFMLSIHNKCPNLMKSKKWLGFQLLTSQSMQPFSQKLVTGSNALTLKHPLHDEFCRILCLPSNEALLETFWGQNVDNLLASPSKNKDQAVIHMANLFIKCVTNKTQVDMLVTPRILDVLTRALNGQLTDKQRCHELHIKARDFLTSLGNVLAMEDVTDKTRLSVLRKIYFESGNLQYEKQTGTHITILLESKLSCKSVQKLVKQFKEVVDGKPQTSGQLWTNRDRTFAAQQLTRLIGHPSCCKEIDWKVEQLLFLLHHGLIREDSGGSIGVELAATMRKCFFRALDQKFFNLETLIEVLRKIVQHIDGFLSQQKASDKTFRISFSDQASSSWRKMTKVVSQLEKKCVSDEKKGSAEQIFLALFLFMGLQLISDPTMAEAALQELHSCYERVKGGKHIAKQTEEPQWVEVTIDLFLSLLSHDSHLLRTIVSIVFPHLSKHLTVSSFYQILEVLDPNQNENPLVSSKELDESESEISSDEEDLPRNSKAKLSNGQTKHQDSMESNESSSDDNDSEGSEDDGDEVEDEGEDSDSFEDMEDDDIGEDETVNDKLRQDVRMALGNAASLTDTESVDLDDIDEEEGQRMDNALAQAFKVLRQSRSNKKSKKQLKSDEAVTHFRVRVLDLVDLYFSREPSMDLCLESLSPLLSLLAFCMKDAHQKPLEARTRSILHKLSSLKKFSSTEGVDENNLADQVKALAIKGARSATTFLGLSDLISECCTFLVRCSEYIRTHSLKEQKSGTKNSIAQIYEALLVDFFTKRDTLLPISMFKSVMHLSWSGCWYLAPLLVRQAFDTNVRPFRRGQAVDLLLLFFRNNRLLDSANEEQLQSLKKLVSAIISKAIERFSSSETHSRREIRFLSEVSRLLHQILSRPGTRPSDTSALSSALTSFFQTCDGVPAEAKKGFTTLSKQLGCNINSLKKSKTLKKIPPTNQENGVSSSEEEDQASVNAALKNTNLKGHKVNGSLDNQHEANGAQPKQINSSKSLKGKNKKNKKLQRMALMGEGLSSGTFSAVSDDVLYGLGSPDEESIESGDRNGSIKLNGISNGTVTKQTKRKKSKYSQLSESQLPNKKVKT